MMDAPQILQIIFLITSWLSLSEGQKLKENIYTEIKNIRPCFRGLNRTSVIGCTFQKCVHVAVRLVRRRPLAPAARYHAHADEDEK